jgi:hypothetical protein
MSSAVCSERAFSQGGITISKRRNCLKGDIVEALQCIKCAIRHDLLFPEPAPTSKLEKEENGTDGELENASTAGEPEGLPVECDESDIEDISWDGLLIEDDDDDEAMYVD